MAPENTRHRLLRAAAKEIAQHGFKGASLRGVAARVDIKAASIFHYFPDGKDQLVRAMLTHIMDTIATTMTPTISAGAGLPPADLIVQCAALLWDFMATYPEYAGALMRGALEPPDVMVDVVRENAQRVVSLATDYFQAAQQAGELGPFHIPRFLMRLATYTMTFHAAPSMRQYILGEQCAVQDERDAFLASLRAEIRAADKV